MSTNLHSTYEAWQIKKVRSSALREVLMGGNSCFLLTCIFHFNLYLYFVNFNFLYLIILLIFICIARHLLQTKTSQLQKNSRKPCFTSQAKKNSNFELPFSSFPSIQVLIGGVFFIYKSWQCLKIQLRRKSSHCYSFATTK